MAHRLTLRASAARAGTASTLTAGNNPPSRTNGVKNKPAIDTCVWSCYMVSLQQRCHSIMVLCTTLEKIECKRMTLVHVCTARFAALQPSDDREEAD
jgi:hypothetical protein